MTMEQKFSIDMLLQSSSFQQPKQVECSLLITLKEPFDWEEASDDSFTHSILRLQITEPSKADHGSPERSRSGCSSDSATCSNTETSPAFSSPNGTPLIRTYFSENSDLLHGARRLGRALRAVWSSKGLIPVTGQIQRRLHLSLLVDDAILSLYFWNA